MTDWALADEMASMFRDGYLPSEIAKAAGMSFDATLTILIDQGCHSFLHSPMCHAKRMAAISGHVVSEDQAFVS